MIEAMNYSVAAGGKRIRPILVMEAFRMFRGKGRYRLALYGGHRDGTHPFPDP